MNWLLHSSAILLAGLFATVAICAQNQPPQPATARSEFTVDYPMDRAGIFVYDTSWKGITGEGPVKTKAAHGIAASLSYGMVPAKVVAQYDGDHAATQSDSGQPILCICHIISLPGQPVIVRLHIKKGSRELDGGRMIVYPIVGGAKVADANRSDLIGVDVTHPDPQVWLIRPQSALAPGEYALMLGTQNINIYPFAVTTGAAGAPAAH